MSTIIPPSPAHRCRNPYRRFFLGLAITFGTLMLLICFLNTWVNPLWVTPTPWSSSSFNDYKPVHKLPRSGKAGLIRSFDWDAVMLGSSRVDIAFNPALPQWNGLRVANLALRGGTLCENAALLRYAAKHEKLKLAIIGVDIADLTSPINIPKDGGFEDSPLGTTGDKFERELRYVAGLSTFTETVKAINYRFFGKRLAAYTDHGHWIRQYDKRPLRAVLQFESFRWAHIFISQRRNDFTVNQTKVLALHDIIDTARKHDIRLVLCIPPNHAAYLSVFRLKNDRDPAFLTDRETIVRVVAEEAAAHPGSPPVEVWDFNDFHPLNCEPLPPPDNATAQSRYWLDGTHASPTLGTVMLSRMMNWPLADPLAASYGEKITTHNLPDRINRIRKQYEQYQHDHPEDFAWVRENMDQFAQ